MFAFKRFKIKAIFSKIFRLRAVSFALKSVLKLECIEQRRCARLWGSGSYSGPRNARSHNSHDFAAQILSLTDFQAKETARSLKSLLKMAFRAKERHHVISHSVFFLSKTKTKKLFIQAHALLILSCIIYIAAVYFPGFKGASVSRNSAKSGISKCPLNTRET